MVADRPLLPLLRDALLVAGVAVLTVQALRRWAGDRYMVPSGSMQPTLHGDPQHGDVVFVGKLARAAGRQRHELVVVQHPDHPDQQLVKRIAARGDDEDACWIEIREGDVWLGANAQRMRREAKDPLEARSMQVTWALWPTTVAALSSPLAIGAASAAEDVLTLAPMRADDDSVTASFTADARRRRRGEHPSAALPAGCIGTARAVDASFVDATGARSRAGDDVGVADCGMELAIERPVDALLGSVDGRDQTLTFCWRARDGRVELWHDGAVAERAELPPFADGPHRVEFGLLDDRVWFVVDGRRDALVVFARPAEAPSTEPRLAPRTHVHVGAVGAEPLRLTGLRVFRDVYYHRERIAGLPGDRGTGPQYVPAGAWYLLGDNTFDSRDSRHFGPVPTSSFLGVPMLVLGPWPRTRWLAR